MRSDNVTKGSERAPNRSLFYALGYTPEELERPLIGVVSAYSEIVPGHMNLDKLADAVKAGIRMAGGTPVLVPAIGVCDGIAMGHIGMKYSLVTRDLIADSTEAMAIAHQFDGLVMIPNCDKNVPGLLMAAARLNIPTIFASGGPMVIMVSSKSAAYSCSKEAIFFRLLWQVVLWARSLALFRAGSSIAARIAMIAITTRSSISVKNVLIAFSPFCRFGFHETVVGCHLLYGNVETACRVV